MKIIKNFRSYLLEDDFKINIFKNRVNITNYDHIGNIDTNKIIVYYEDGEVLISGKSLSLLKMVDNEILISGTINNIELRWLYEKYF